jgi:DNA-binding MarR family transcriptional regulator
MQVFAQLRALAEFPRRNLAFLETLEDHDLVSAIGHYQVLGVPITLKQLLMQGIGSVATVQRRLQRLKRLGVIVQRRSETDRRAVELTLSPACMKAFAKYAPLLSQAAASQGRARNDQARHLCALCDGDADCKALAMRFLKDGLREKQTCLLVGPQGFRDSTLAGLERSNRKRPTAGRVVQSGGEKSPAEMLASLQRVFQDTRTGGRTACLMGEMSWMRGKMNFNSLMDFEARLDPLLRRYGVSAICEYDVRRFKGPQLLRALKAHPDTSRYPLMMG